jgi:hypothetical protein
MIKNLVYYHKINTIKCKKTRINAGFFSVENIGFEPITSSLPAKRSSQMS